MIWVEALRRDFKEVGKEAEILDESKDRTMALSEEIIRHWELNPGSETTQVLARPELPNFGGQF